MSVTRPDGTQVDVDRPNCSFVTNDENHWAGNDRSRWRNLAALCLHEICGWPLRLIGLADGRHKGQLSRALKRTKEALAEFLGSPPPAGTCPAPA